MVDAVVSTAVKKLRDAVVNEAYFLLSVCSKVEGLCDELGRIQSFLSDADRKAQQGDDRIRNWVMEMRDVAYDAEDIIDTYTLKVDSAKGTTNFIHRKAVMVKNMVNLHRVGKDIVKLQHRLKVITTSKDRYGIKGLGDDVASASQTEEQKIQLSLRNRYSHAEDSDIVGFEQPMEKLLEELMKDDEKRRVLSIVGVGCLGKITLAKKLYRHASVKSRFYCCAWGYISQQFNVKEVLLQIAKSMSLPVNELQMSELDLIEKLYSYLADKRYFIVLDDLWKFEHWTCLSPAFPPGSRGSKVLLTTRIKTVPLHIHPDSIPYEPKFLDDEESWELLCKKAFPQDLVKGGLLPGRN